VIQDASRFTTSRSRDTAQKICSTIWEGGRHPWVYFVAEDLLIDGEMAEMYARVPLRRRPPCRFKMLALQRREWRGPPAFLQTNRPYTKRPSLWGLIECTRRRRAWENPHHSQPARWHAGTNRPEDLRPFNPSLRQEQPAKGVPAALHQTKKSEDHSAREWGDPQAGRPWCS